MKRLIVFFLLIAFCSQAFALFDAPKYYIIINQADLNGSDLTVGTLTANIVDANAVFANYFVARNYIDANFLMDANFNGDVGVDGSLFVDGMIYGTDLYSGNFVYTAYLADNFGVGNIDMTGDPWALLGTDFWIDENLFVIGDVNVDGDFNAMTVRARNGMFVGNPGATDPFIVFESGGGDGLMWWEDVGDRFNFDHGITVDGTVGTDELVTQSIRWAIGDYLVFNPTDNNWSFLIDNVEVFGISETGDINAANVGISGYYFGDGSK